MRGEINLGWWQEEGDIGQVARGGGGGEVSLGWCQDMR